jgi:hypothetical protein
MTAESAFATSYRLGENKAEGREVVAITAPSDREP